MTVTMTETPRIYVGTYLAYNDGSLFGDWFDLTNYSDKDEFYAAITKYHKREKDPEFMFQDYENIPERFVTECSIDEKFWDYLTAIEDFDEDRLEALQDFVANDSSVVDNGIDKLINEFDDKYQGQYDSEEAFSDNWAEQVNGWFTVMENAGISTSYFDNAQYARDLFCNGFWMSDNNHVFSD